MTLFIVLAVEDDLSLPDDDTELHSDAACDGSACDIDDAADERLDVWRKPQDIE